MISGKFRCGLDKVIVVHWNRCNLTLGEWNLFYNRSGKVVRERGLLSIVSRLGI